MQDPINNMTNSNETMRTLIPSSELYPRRVLKKGMKSKNHLNRSKLTASFIILSPKIRAWSLSSALISLKVLRTLTGSVALIKVPKMKQS